MDNAENKKKVEVLYEEYREKVYRYILHKIGNAHLAEDLCSEVFLKVFEKYYTYDPSKASCSTWIYTITHNTVINYFRRRKLTYELSDQEIDVNSSPEMQYLHDEVLDRMAELLKGLSERERNIIIMNYYYNVPLMDIATKLNLSYANVRVIQARALKKLRGTLETEGQGTLP